MRGNNSEKQKAKIFQQAISHQTEEEQRKMFKEMRQESREQLTPTEKIVFMHRYAGKIKFGSVKRPDELIRKIGFEEAAKLSTDEFLKRVASETEATPQEPMKRGKDFFTDAN